MDKATAVLYHNDADGFGAAFAHNFNLGGDNTAYIPVQYGQPVPEIPGEATEVFILDFSYDRATCDGLAEKYDLTVIDHHKTAEKELEGAEYAVFNMSKSGCVLAWEFFSSDPVPTLLKYVQDRDLWKWEMHNSEEINLGVAAMDFSFDAWACTTVSELETSGVAIKSFRDGQIKTSMKSVRMLELICPAGTFEVPVANATANISELGNEMCKAYPDAPFSASYCDRQDKRTWSLRSIGDSDVSAVAKSLGGGGHKNAAGFTTEIGWPGYVGTDFLNAFEEATNEKTSP